MIGRFGVGVGWLLLMRQFQRCQCAAEALRVQAQSVRSEGAPGPSDKSSDPVVNEACPLWSADGAKWLWRRGGDSAGAFCCASWLLSQ